MNARSWGLWLAAFTLLSLAAAGLQRTLVAAVPAVPSNAVIFAGKDPRGQDCSASFAEDYSETGAGFARTESGWRLQGRNWLGLHSCRGGTLGFTASGHGEVIVLWKGREAQRIVLTADEQGVILPFKESGFLQIFSASQDGDALLKNLVWTEQ